ncbi:MAG: glycoside hydrolase family 1 protein [Candidatus Yanofskybacteria bacterium]|nr:glycoside hydrolase family 1 protein [Candidatus Yanofskybacteria bacterium]
MDKKLEFPVGFLWGSATSSYQVEGGIENNDWSEAAEKGRVPAAGRACDSFNRYSEDFDIAKSLGHNAHRFSIEWAKIEPEEGRFDDGAVEHYRKVLSALRERGVEPFVTLWHFTLPVWFARMGGFENKKSPFYFARYCEYVVSRLTHSAGSGQQGGIGVRFWITINEPMVYVGQGYARGVWPPFKKNFIKVLRAVDNLITSHNIVYEKIKELWPDSLVGIAVDQADHRSSYNPLSLFMSIFLSWFHNRLFVSRISRHQDFIGINYYRPIVYYGRLNLEKSDMNWDIYPKGIYNVLMRLKRYRKPIYITENGIADATDGRRAKYIKDHLRWVWQAINDGVDMRGYFYWSLLDNFEWARGFGPRFGLVEMNYDTMERKIRPSAYEYKKICETNSLDF